MGIREDLCIPNICAMLTESETRIRQAFGEVTNIMRDNTWRELASRLQMLQENGGSHVEVY